METSRKKTLEKMQKGLVSYKLLTDGWDVSDHLGDGYDLIAEKAGRFVRIELKAIDLNCIKERNNATQSLSANEIVTATHLVVTVFRGIEMDANYIMSIRQFVDASGVKKYNDYGCFEHFLEEYKKMAVVKSKLVKNAGETTKRRLSFDFSFNPSDNDKWKLVKFKDNWGCLENEELTTGSTRTVFSAGAPKPAG